MLANVFMPLFEVTVDPSSHPELHLFLQHVRSLYCGVMNLYFSHWARLHIACVAFCHTGGGFRQCGWRVKTRATHLQPGQSAASQLDGGGQPALFLLPLLHVCKHDGAESPAQVRVYTSVQVATIICFLWMQSLPHYMFYLFTRNNSSTLIFQDH